MSEQSNENIRKLDESFGQYSHQTTVNPEASVTADSEDDKKQPLADDLTLSYDQPSTNDAPGQKVSDTPTEAQSFISEKLLSDEAFVKAEKYLKENEEAAIKKIEDTAKNISKQLEEKSDQNPAAKCLENLADTFAEDPAKGFIQVGKGILMAAGAIALLKGIFRRK